MISTETASSALSHGKLPWWTRLVSVLLVLHLIVLVITPSRENYFRQHYFHWFEPYINFFEFSSDWTFFSPDPGPPASVEWKIYDESGAEMKSGTFPDLNKPFLILDRQVRMVSAMRFMLLRDGIARSSLVPYLCESNPGAFSVRLSRVFKFPPSLADVASGKKDAHDQSGFDHFDLGTEFCEKPNKSI